MKRNDIVKQLIPGIVVGFILGLILVSLVGVNTEDVIPNYIGGAMCCLVPTLLNTLIVLKSSSKILKRKISIIEILKRSIPYLLLSAITGLFVVAVIVEKVLNIDTRTISVLVTAIYESLLGVVTSTIFAYLALKKYIKDVKYTKRK